MMTPRPRILPGPWLLRTSRPDLATHRATHGELPTMTLARLQEVIGTGQVRGRGGAGFPFATKLGAVAGRRGRRHVVINFSEGEPVSHKDLALALNAPHLVLDGACISAQALDVRTIQLVLPRERHDLRDAIELALAERRRHDPRSRVRWDLHLAAPRFVSGEASAVTELIAGRTPLPVTSWEPTAMSGVRGRPTLLSNAETFAHVAALVLPGGDGYAALGTPEEPGTTLLTLVHGPEDIEVVEVPHGSPWEDVLTAEQACEPLLLGGYHGTWVPAGGLRGQLVSRAALASQGLALGAGVVMPLPRDTCPLELTAQLLRYLAAQSAGRCGPCLNGLPALAHAFEQAVAGLPGSDLDELTSHLVGRGACAHPDGTVRLVRSALLAFPEEAQSHSHGNCLTSGRVRESVR